MLVRLEKEKLIKRKPFSVGIADWFMLPKTPAKNQFHYLHDVGCADIFSRLYPEMEAWSYEPQVGNTRSDRGMKLKDKVVYFEVDRATEKEPQLREKIESFIQYGRETNQQFYVVFALLADFDVVMERGKLLRKLFSEYKR
jgi:hypothetical protein